MVHVRTATIVIPRSLGGCTLLSCHPPSFVFSFTMCSLLISPSFCGADDWKVAMCNVGIEDMLTAKDHDLKTKAADILVLLLSEGQFAQLLPLDVVHSCHTTYLHMIQCMERVTLIPFHDSWFWKIDKISHKYFVVNVSPSPLVNVLKAIPIASFFR